MSPLTNLLPLVLIGLAGFFAAKVKLLDQGQTDALSKVCFTLLIPIFLFNSTYHADLSEQISVSWFLSFYLPVAFLMLLVYGWHRFRLKASASQSAIAALVASYSNTVIVAIPILNSLFSPEIAARAFVLIAFHGAIVFTLTEGFIHQFKLNTLLHGFKNPVVMSILAGLLCNLMAVPLPELLIQPMTQLSKGAIPLALLALGAAMAFMPIRGNRTHSFSLSLVKLFLLPTLVYISSAYLFGLTEAQVIIVVLLSASPTAAVSFLLAVRHNSYQEVAGSTVVLSTLLALVSHLFWLTILL